MAIDWIQRMLERLRNLPDPAPPVISTPYGPVTEWARRQAAANMAADPVLRSVVEAKLIAESGGDEAAGMAKARARYPEAYANDKEAS